MGIFDFFKEKKVNQDIKKREKRKKKAQRRSEENESKLKEEKKLIEYKKTFLEEEAEWLDANFNKYNREEQKAVAQLIFQLLVSIYNNYGLIPTDGEKFEAEVINLAKSVILKYSKDSDFKAMIVSNFRFYLNPYGVAMFDDKIKNNSRAIRIIIDEFKDMFRNYQINDLK